MPLIRITKSAIDALPRPERGQHLYFDTDMKGFGVVVGRTAKTYIAQRNVNGRTVRVTIGKHGVFTPDEARRDARELLVQMARGENPIAVRRAARTASLTLVDAFADFQIARAALKGKTLSTYKRMIEGLLGGWKAKPLAEITGDMIARRHLDLAKGHGQPTANVAMRVFRSVYNFARAANGTLPENPVRRLSQSRSWFPERRRRTYIRVGELGAWYRGVMALDNAAARDYLRLILFTGMRRSEAARLKWADVDLNARVLTVRETKNGDDLVLPLSVFLHDLLKGRREATAGSPWAFPGFGEEGHVNEPKKWIDKVRKASGVEFTLHDLRRTFITIAESLDMSWSVLKRLLNHREGRDVTAGYIVLDVERLRRPMERISNFIASACAEANNTAAVIDYAKATVASNGGRNSQAV